MIDKGEENSGLHDKVNYSRRSIGISCCHQKSGEQAAIQQCHRGSRICKETWLNWEACDGKKKAVKAILGQTEKGG